MTKELLTVSGEPTTLTAPPNISEYLKAQLADCESPVALIKDVEAQVETSALAAFGKEYNFKAVIDDTGSVRILQILDIVENVTDEYRQVSLKNARKINPEIKLGARIANALEYDELATPFGVLRPTKAVISNVSLVNTND